MGNGLATAKIMNNIFFIQGCVTIFSTPENQAAWHDCTESNKLCSSMVVRKFSILVKDAIEKVTIDGNNSGYL